MYVVYFTHYNNAYTILWYMYMYIVHFAHYYMYMFVVHNACTLLLVHVCSTLQYNACTLLHVHVCSTQCMYIITCTCM